MKLPVFSEWIEGAISRYIAEHRHTHPEIVRAVERANALPLDSDWNGCVAIRVDGELIEVLWDTPELAKVESDPHWRFVALVAGAKRYAELAHLMPARTEWIGIAQHARAPAKYLDSKNWVSMRRQRLSVIALVQAGYPQMCRIRD
jgi:hypothetical protein